MYLIIQSSENAPTYILGHVEDRGRMSRVIGQTVPPSKAKKFLDGKEDTVWYTSRMPVDELIPNNLIDKILPINKWDTKANYKKKNRN